MATVRIGSRQVDVNHVLETSAWYLLISASLALFAVLMARFRRLADAHRVPHPIRVRMLHVVGLQCTLTLGSLDPNHIFFGWARFVGMLAYGLFMIIGTNLILFYFFSHAETYIVSHSTLTAPAWLVNLRNAWMAADLLGGLLLLAVSMSLERQWLEGLPFVFSAVQLLLLGPVLAAIVVHVSRQLECLYSSVTLGGSSASTMHADIKSFRRNGLLSALVIAAFGVIVMVSFVPTFRIDKSLTYRELPGYFNKVGNERWTFAEWTKWTAMAGLFYALRLHWIPKEPSGFLSKHVYGGARKSTDELEGADSSAADVTLRTLDAAPSRADSPSLRSPPPSRADSPSVRRPSPAGLLRMQSTRTMRVTANNADHRRQQTAAGSGDSSPSLRKGEEERGSAHSRSGSASCSKSVADCGSGGAGAHRPPFDSLAPAPSIVTVMYEPLSDDPTSGNTLSASDIESRAMLPRSDHTPSPDTESMSMTSPVPRLSTFESDNISSSHPSNLINRLLVNTSSGPQSV